MKSRKFDYKLAYLYLTRDRSLEILRSHRPLKNESNHMERISFRLTDDAVMFP